MRLLLSLSIPALMFLAACGGDDDSGPGANKLVDVFPDSGYVGRTLDVVLSGDTTAFDSSSTVSFGDKVTVTKIEVTGPDSLVATLQIDPTAPVGKVDVAVTTAGNTINLPQAFELDAPVTAMAAANFQQGGLGSIVITNNDLLHPFDTTQDEDTGDFTNVTVNAAGSGVSLSVSDVTPDTITLSALIDVDATSTGPITITSGTTMSPVDAVAVTARTPQAITLGTPANFTVADNGTLLVVSAEQAGLLNLRLSTTDTQSAFSPSFVLLPASGKWSDLIEVHQNFGDTNADVALDNRVVAAGDKFYVVALELGIFGVPGYPATIDAKTISLTGVNTVADTGDNNTPATAQAIQGPVAEFDGSLSDIDDVDCFKITTNMANKKIHVYTTDDNGSTDSIAQIFGNATQTDLATPLVDTDDADLGDDSVTDALAAGTRAICVSPSTFIDSITNGAYKAFIVVE